MMLYTLYEMQHAAFHPVRFAADQGQQFFRQPLNPLSHTPLGKFMAASCDMVEQLTRRYGKPKFGFTHTTIDGNEVEVEEQIVARKTFGQLKRFKRKSLRQDPKVLVVAPMSGHFATLLRGTVEALLPDHDVYITDWRDARDIPMTEGSFDLDDYIDYIIDWLDDLGTGVHVVAVCQPSVPVLAAVSLMEAEKNPCAPATLTMMGGPIDTRANPTEVNDLATKRPLSWFKENVITVVPLPNAGVMRKVYPGFLQLAGFMTMNLGDHVMKHHALFEHLVVGDGESAEKTKSFYEEYRSVMDMTAEFYLQTIEVVFQRHLLPKGEWVSRGRKIDPSKITRTAIMAVEGELDDISGVGQTKAALDISTGLADAKKKYLLADKVGHYGIFNGRRWREVIAPEVKAFMRAHDTAFGNGKTIEMALVAGALEDSPKRAPQRPKRATTRRKSATTTTAKRRAAPRKTAAKPTATGSAANTAATHASSAKEQKAAAVKPEPSASAAKTPTAKTPAKKTPATKTARTKAPAAKAPSARKPAAKKATAAKPAAKKPVSEKAAAVKAAMAQPSKP